jgi:hypothetical protein
MQISTRECGKIQSAGLTRNEGGEVASMGIFLLSGNEFGPGEACEAFKYRCQEGGSKSFI